MTDWILIVKKDEESRIIGISNWLSRNVFIIKKQRAGFSGGWKILGGSYPICAIIM